MPYNPCGYIVDVTRRAHDEPCRFFNNTDRIDTVRFYEALPNAPTLPFWSVVYCSENDPVKWPLDTIGTLRQTPFPFTGRVSPAGLTFLHFCGTESEFANGATYDAARPPAPIGANGLPLCCFAPPRVGGGAGGGGLASYRVHPAIALRGGAGAGGRATYHAVVWIDATEGGYEFGGEVGDAFHGVDAPEGGYEFGGEVGDAFHGVDAPEGGYEFGGEVGDVFSGTAPEGGYEFGGQVGDVFHGVDPTAGGYEFGGENVAVPGPTCETAGPIIPDSGYEGTIGLMELNWFTFNQEAGKTYTVWTTDLGANTSTNAFTGDCSALVSLIGGYYFGTGNASWTAAADGPVWLFFTGIMAGTYRMKLTQS